MDELKNFLITIGRSLTENQIVTVSVVLGAFAIAIALFLCALLIKNLGKTKKKVLLAFAIIDSVCIFIIFVFLILGWCGVYPPKEDEVGNDGIEISTIEVYFENDKIEDEMFVSFLDNDKTISFGIIINGNENDSEKADIILSFAGDSLGCELNGNNVTIGDTLGKVEILISAESKNVSTKSIFINIIAPTSLDLLEIKAVSPNSQKFIEGQIFIPDNEVKLQATFINILNDKFNVFVKDYKYDDNVELTPLDSEIKLTYTHKTATRMCLLPIVVANKKLQNIEIIDPPTTTTYIEGQKLSTEGMTIKANYEFISKRITDFVVAETGKALSPDMLSFSIVYSENGITKSVRQKITVAPRTLQSITIDSNPTYLSYVQGQYFNTSGLKVTAHYEYMDSDVTESLIFDLARRLSVTDTEINYSYSENGITKGGKFDIEVFEPYTQTRKITFENPFDAALSWIYTYTNDSGEVCVDDTIFSPYDNLSFEQENGVYIVPSGATVILSKISPALIGFKIDDKSVTLDYPTSTYEFFLPITDDDIEIEFIRVIGERTTVRFSSFEREQNFAFIYPYEYSGCLSAKDLAQISQIYEDTDNEYYTFICGENEYSYSELTSVIINNDTVFVAKKHKRAVTDSVVLELVYGGSSFNAVVDVSDFVSLNSLPRIERVGYSLGFSLTDGGELLNDTTFNEFLITAKNGDKLYAKYTLTAIAVTGDILGEWSYEDVSQQIEVMITFNADGTYSYCLIKDGAENCAFNGIYKMNLSEEASYSILSIETTYDYTLFSINELTLELENGKLKSVAFIQDLTKLIVTTINIELTKQIEDD